MEQNQETQPIESLLLSEGEITFFPFSHRSIHRYSKTWTTIRGVRRKSGKNIDATERYTSSSIYEQPLVLPHSMHR
jgi:hypothetical protein